MVDYNDISVVISGPVFSSKENGRNKGWTAYACESVRKVLPGAEIVLSTWEGTDCSALDYDILVLSQDPGPNKDNVNRQICSRLAGIRKATRNFLVAMRSESVIVNTNFLNYFCQYQLHGGNDNKILSERVIIPASMPVRAGELFHMGDWYYFGRKEDLLELWDLPYCNDELINKEKDDIYYNAHRYLITAFVKKYRDLQFEKRKDINNANKNLYEQILVENFVIIGLYDYGIQSLKYPLNYKFCKRMWDYWASYSFNDWKKMYNKVCKGNLKIKRTYKEMMGIYLYVPAKNIRIIAERNYGRVCGKLLKMKKRVFKGRFL